jgi:hypothetical protein
MPSAKHQTKRQAIVRICFLIILNCQSEWLDDLHLKYLQGLDLQVWAWPFFRHPIAARTSIDPQDR